MDIGVSPVAARLALSKSSGVVKKQRMDVACNWLLEEKNRDEIEAAENDEIEKSVAGIEIPSDDQCDEIPIYVAPRSPRLSSGSDQGCGLGLFMSRKSLPSYPSPRQVPVPGRLSLGSVGSRVSLGSCGSGVQDDGRCLGRRVSIGSQTSAASEEFQPSMSPARMGQAKREEGVEHKTSEMSLQPSTACSDGDEPEIEEHDEEEEEEMAPLLCDPVPPSSACWDWPLSRQEKIARVQLIERQMSAMDRQGLLEECKSLRSHLRKASVGGSDRKPSRLST
jgi:hypothetical protein